MNIDETSKLLEKTDKGYYKLMCQDIPNVNKHKENSFKMLRRMWLTDC